MKDGRGRYLNRCGVAKLVRRLIVNQEMRRFESGPHSHFRGQGLLESRLPWEQESPSSTLGTPTREWGLDVVGGMRVLQTRWMGSSPIVSTFRLWIGNLGLGILRRELRVSRFVRFGARVAQRKSDTRGEGLMRVQISPRAPTGLRIADCGMKTRHYLAHA